VHTTADVLPALRVAVPATITPQWRSCFYGMGAADADDHTVDVDDRADACPPPVWATSFYGIVDAALVLVQAEVAAENAANPRSRPATPALRLRLWWRLRKGTPTRCRCWCYGPRRTSTRPRRTTAQRLLARWLATGAWNRCRWWYIFLSKSNRKCTS
jgi:hypothetical protein